MSKLSDVVQKLEGFLHEKAVWEEINEHLAKFIDTETLEAPNHIAAEGCISQTVPQAVIQDFIDTITEQQIVPLDEQIDTLENLQVEETDDGEENPKTPTKKKASGKKVIKPSSKKPQGVRAVPRSGGKAPAGSRVQTRRNQQAG